MIFVNFKTYPEASGNNAIKLAKIISEVAGETNIEIIACPQAVDLREALKVSDHPASPSKPWRSRVWVQHVDSVEQGRATGWFPPEVARDLGVEGVLLNHSEHKLSVGVLAETLNRSKEVGLKTLVFADSIEEAKIVAKFKPDYIGYEPPELIAAKETSVARSKPDVIEKVVKEIPDIPILIGAGVKDRNDVGVGLERGAKGVVLSSAVVLSQDPRAVLLDLTQGFK